MSAIAAHRIKMVRGDITRLQVDAIVTSANESLCGGGGVDGAIHRAAGPGLLEECRTLGICNPGEAKITGGYLLPAKHLIHTVGPVWEGGKFDEADVLRSCYYSTLEIAESRECRSIAFPCIATGVYDFPREAASEIAIQTVGDFLSNHALPEMVIFCCFDEEDAAIYERRLEESSIA